MGVEGEQKTESKENLEKRAHDLVTGMWRFEFALLKKKSKIDGVPKIILSNGSIFPETTL